VDAAQWQSVVSMREAPWFCSQHQAGEKVESLIDFLNPNQPLQPPLSILRKMQQLFS
jgi:hypothetical protein